MSTPALFHAILSSAISAEASDVHLVSGMSPWWRIKGKIQPMAFPFLHPATIEAILANIKPNYLQKEQREYDFSWMDAAYKNARFRIHAFNHQSGMSLVIRILPLKIPRLDDLQLPPVLKEIALLKQGLVLITGPTGSGKTTTLAAIIHYRNEQTCGHIMTIEDPIEFIHVSKNCLITQQEVYRDVKSFSQALHGALRADPNVILVGELRDLETIRLAITAAETGHLVLATLHTASAEKTLHRMIDVFPGNEKESIRLLLAESLESIIAQRLVETTDGNCVPMVEILRATPAVRHLIRENKQAQIISAIQTGEKWGMQTLEQSKSLLIQKGLLLD